MTIKDNALFVVTSRLISMKSHHLSDSICRRWWSPVVKVMDGKHLVNYFFWHRTSFCLPTQLFNKVHLEMLPLKMFIILFIFKCIKMPTIALNICINQYSLQRVFANSNSTQSLKNYIRMCWFWIHVKWQCVLMRIHRLYSWFHLYINRSPTKHLLTIHPRLFSPLLMPTGNLTHWE